MFENAKVGDRVWDFVEHWGVITEISHNGHYPLIVKFDNNKKNEYRFDGKVYDHDSNPRLFWDEIKFEVPKKPFNLEEELRKLKVKKFISGEYNYYLVFDNSNNHVNYDDYECWENPTIVYFDDYDKLKEVIENINEHNVTKEEFFTAYKNVFGGK